MFEEDGGKASPYFLLNQCRNHIIAYVFGVWGGVAKFLPGQANIGTLYKRKFRRMGGSVAINIGGVAKVLPDQFWNPIQT